MLRTKQDLDSRILLTGGTGFFGRSVLGLQGSLAIRKARLTVLSRDPQKFRRQQPALATLADWIKGDILSLNLASFHDQFTHVFHAAADSCSAQQLSYPQRFDQIVCGTRQMLEVAVQRGARRFLYISSGAGYGKQPVSLAGLPEDYWGMPDTLVADNVYGVAKRAAEHLCALYAREHGLEIVIARCFAFVGEDLPVNAHFAIGNFVRDALWSDEVVVTGDGTQIRSYLDQRDLAHWLMSLLQNGKAGEAYNVGSEQAISIADLAHLVRDLVSPGKPVRILGNPAHNAERSRYVPDIKKIASHLGHRPTYTLEQSISDMAAAIRSRGKGV